MTGSDPTRPASALRGLHVLVTRPAARAEGLCEAIAARGGRPIRFPVIELEALPEPLRDEEGGGPLRYDVLVFVSPAAVEHGAGWVEQLATRGCEIAAVGAATADALRARGLDVAVQPAEDQSTEGLLAHPALDAGRVAGRRVLIVRGQGGRADLRAGLVARGATVHYAEVYRRRVPSDLDPGQPAGADVLTATSIEALHNLLAIVDARTRERLLDAPLVTASERIAQAARDAGFRREPVVARGASDEAIVAALEACAAALSNGSSESA